MLIKYVGRLPAPVEVPGIDLVVTSDDPVEVPENVAERLLEQPDNWQAVKASKAKTTDPITEEEE